MSIVVLGAGGKLGQLLRPVFPDTATWLSRAHLDIKDTDALTTALHGADAVFCFAGITHGRSEPMKMNSDLAVHTLDAAQRAGAGRVFLLSSAAVYGRLPGLLTEDGPTAPISPYGVAKLAMEGVAARHRHPNTVLRLGNVAGADAILNGWHNVFQMECLSDGTTPQRSYIGPRALARVLATLAATGGLPPLLNVAAPGCVQMGALLDAAGLAWSRRPATSTTIPVVNLDTKRLRLFTEFKASDSTPEGIVADWQNGLT